MSKTKTAVEQNQMFNETEQQVQSMEKHTESTELGRLLDKPLGGAFASMGDFANYQRMAKMLADSTMVPDQFKNNIGNCVIALNLANRLNTDVFFVMQSLYIVHGKPGWSAAFVIGRLNECGRFGPIEFVFNKDRTECFVKTTHLKTGSELRGATISIGMANAEGWVNRNGSKWKTMPELMLTYRAATFFGRQYAADLLLGMQTAEELSDAGAEIKQSANVNTSDLNQRLLESKANSLKQQQSTKAMDGPSYAEIAGMLHKSASLDDVDTAESLINGFPEDQTQELLELAETKRKDFI